MANELELKYSSGSASSSSFISPRRSIGGIITGTNVPQNLNALFGKISLKTISQGSEDYRLVFLKNAGAYAIVAVAATGIITIINNSIIDLDTIEIGGVSLIEGTDFNKGGTDEITATSIKAAIDANPTLSALITATVDCNKINITAIVAGTVGNSITMSYTDSGSGVAVSLSGGTLQGGIDAVAAVNISNLRFYVDAPKISPVLNPIDLGTKAVISIDNNAVIAGDTFTIAGVALVEGVDFSAGATDVLTATAIKSAIDGHPTLSLLVTTAVVLATVEITALDQVANPTGEVPVSYTDSGSGVAASITGYGVNTSAISPITINTKWIVPASAVGLWLKQNEDNNSINENEGKVATWDGVAWVFAFSPFAKFEFGFVNPIDVTLGDTILEKSFVNKIGNVFEQPSGITFLSADGSDNELTIGTGNLAAGEQIGMWIKRIVDKFKINSFDLITDDGGIVLDEVTPILFTYDTP